MRKTGYVYLLAAVFAAGCGDNSSTSDGPSHSADLSMKNTSHADMAKPGGKHDLELPPSDDAGQGTDDASETMADSGGTTDDGGLFGNMPDTISSPNDLAVTVPPDMAITAPADLKGQPPADLAIAASADMKGTAPADMATAPADMATAPDMVVPVTSGLIFKGDLSLFDVTSDGYAIFWNHGTGNIDFIPIAGGSPTKIVAAGTSPQVIVDGKVAFVWSNPDASGVGPLWTWSLAAGVQNPSTYSLAGYEGASSDGKVILYTRNTRANATLTDLTAARTDQTASVVLQSGMANGGTTTCSPSIAIAGVYAIAARCASGSMAATVTDWNLTNNVTKDLITNAHNTFTTDKAATQAVVISTAGSLQVVPLGAGGPTTIASSVGYGYQTQDGSAAVYRDTSGALWRSPLVNPSPVQLVKTGAKFILGHSPDDNWTLYASTVDANGTTTDLYAVSKSMPLKPTQLDAKTDGVIGGIFGDPFTADSTHALPVVNVDINNLIGTLLSQSMASGIATTQATNTWYARAATGSKIAFNDNFVAGTTGGGTGDLKSVDTAGGAPAVISAGADLTWSLAPSKTSVVYTTHAATPGPGLYASPIP